MIRRPSLVLALLLSASLTAPILTPAWAKEPAKPAPVVKGATAAHAMVAAANPAAVAAGLHTLKAGGTAADAAVAIQAVLGLVEPESSGLAGGSFMVFYDAKTKQVTAYNGRETAPAAATGQWFLDDAGKPLPFATAVLSGRSTGVPGAIAMLSMAHKDHGKLPWSSLFGDAEHLADTGFTVTNKLGNAIVSNAPQAKGADAQAYFTKPDGTKYKAGDTMKNPAYAKTLRLLAAQGPDAILKGPIAKDIVDRVRQGDHASLMTLDDLANYKPIKAEALCVAWKVKYRVCTDRPPSGGSALLHALLLSEHTDIDKRGPNDPVAWSEMAQIERLMYVDRDFYVGDPSFVNIPTAGWLSPEYVAQRAKLITTGPIGPPPPLGKPPGADQMFGPDHTMEPGGTTHMVIVDRWGNVVSMTTTVESIFGSGRMVDGFFLNNQLTDFSFSPVQADGAPAANAVAGGKRPRSAMSPVIVLDQNSKLVAAMGSPGGPSIISYNLKSMIGYFDWRLSLQKAFDLPNMVARGNSFSSETALYEPGVVDGLAKLGVTVREGAQENSGMHGVVVENGKLVGAADRRREGIARGY